MQGVWRPLPSRCVLVIMNCLGPKDQNVLRVPTFINMDQATPMQYESFRVRQDGCAARMKLLASHSGTIRFSRIDSKCNAIRFSLLCCRDAIYPNDDTIQHALRCFRNNSVSPKLQCASLAMPVRRQLFYPRALLFPVTAMLPNPGCAFLLLLVFFHLRRGSFHGDGGN